MEGSTCGDMHNIEKSIISSSWFWRHKPDASESVGKHRQWQIVKVEGYIALARMHWGHSSLNHQWWVWTSGRQTLGRCVQEELLPHCRRPPDDFERDYWFMLQMCSRREILLRQWPYSSFIAMTKSLSTAKHLSVALIRAFCLMHWFVRNIRMYSGRSVNNLCMPNHIEIIWQSWLNQNSLYCTARS